MTKEEIEKVINQGKELLLENNWINEQDFSKFCNNKKIRECIEKCTSPNKNDIFNAFKLFPLEQTQVLIIGQDPYPAPNNKADGFAFSQKGQKSAVDSLKNIFDAVDEYLMNKAKKPLNRENTALKIWAKNNNVLLLNTVLTYDEKNSFKLRKEAWQPFIEKIIRNLLSYDSNKLVVFLWGDKAQTLFNNVVYQMCKNKKQIIRNLLVLSTSHPSNQSYKRGFSVEAPIHFQVCNEFLGNEKAIKWENI